MHAFKVIIVCYFLLTALCCISPNIYDTFEDIEAGDLNGLWKQTGLASWYGEEFDGRKTASGEIYDMNGYTAAHRTLPFGTIVLVRNIENSREVKVKINDRGPFKKGRIIDLSYAAAEKIEMLGKGVVEVVIYALDGKD
jgi:rare lipoprotein A